MTTEVKQDDYEALGIFPDTWACISVGEKRLAKEFLFKLAQSGVPAIVSADADGKNWHIAVQGGLKSNPLAWIVSIRGEAYSTVTCPVGARGQHPQAKRDVDR
jgi:hypothetical protein